jgi:hypothetical protein
VTLTDAVPLAAEPVAAHAAGRAMAADKWVEEEASGWRNHQFPILSSAKSAI